MVGVAGVHGLLMDRWAEWQQATAHSSRVPARLSVQLTRPAELKPVAPPAWPRPPQALPRLNPPSAAPSVQTADLPELLGLPGLPAAEGPSAQSLPSVASEPALAESGPVFPLSARLRYQLTGNYRGPVHGDAEVEWLRQGRRYQVRLEVSVGPKFAPFIRRVMVSEGELGPDGVQPARYDEETRQLLRTRESHLRFAEGQIEFNPAGRREASPPGVQDTASQFVQLTWLVLSGRLSLEPGAQVALPLALPRRLYAWRYEVIGQETLNTPIGPLAAWELRPQVDDAKGTLRATVWLAPALQFLPARIRIVQDDETYVDLLLAETPQQEQEPPRGGGAGPDNPTPSQGEPTP